jgi:DNA (cytosine-5)-methyltransferase 1
MLTIGSLFSGIGGLELGLEWAGLGPVKWQVEYENHAQRILEKHWPNVKRHKDVRKCSKSNLEYVDLICGGFPCQDISSAGRKAGIKDGTRSGLWFEMFRIIRELQPKYALIENVADLAIRGLDIVLADIASIGYDAEWQIVSACSLGAAHTRERMFIIAYPHQTSNDCNVVRWRKIVQGGGRN